MKMPLTRINSMQWKTLVGLLSLLYLSCCTPTIWAQGPSAVQRPTISPYLQLGRADTGPLPNYHTFVQPQFQVLRQQQLQWAAIQRLETSPVFDARSGSPAGSARATGRGGHYMNRSHFYPQR
jgi:hypothetical protein